MNEWRNERTNERTNNSSDVTGVLRSCIHSSHPIRLLLTLDAAKMITHSVVSLRLDYANTLLHGTSATNVNKLAENTLARVDRQTGLQCDIKQLHSVTKRQDRPCDVQDISCWHLLTRSSDAKQDCLVFVVWLRQNQEPARDVRNTLRDSRVGYAAASSNHYYGQQ